MTTSDPTPTPPDAVPPAKAQPQGIAIDAVGGLFRRSARHFEAEALNLAAALRETDAALAAERARIAQLEAQLAALQVEKGIA